jgi:DNA-directed RNA polymerase specialized sigma24 family protein
MDREGNELPPEEVVATYRQYQTLQQGMENLGDRCRRLLQLLYYDTSVPSYADVAEILDMPIGSIGPMRARCLKKLRGILNGLVGDD